MQFLVVVFLLGVLNKCKGVVLDNGETFYWTEKDPVENIVETTLGYRIEVTVQKVSVKSEENEHILIKSGQSLDDTGNGIIITHHIDNPKVYLIDSNRAYFKYNKVENSESSFTIAYKRVGVEKITTTASPETTVILPTSKPETTDHITVYIEGRNYYEYADKNVQLELRNSLAYMATEYVKLNNIKLNETVDSVISKNNVVLKELRRCPFNFPNRENCITMTFSLPIFVEDIFGYQLNTSHLTQMWNRMADDFLKPNDMVAYEVPDNGTATMWWLVLSGSVLAAVLLVSFAIKYFATKSYKSVKRKTSIDDTVNQVVPENLDCMFEPDPIQPQSMNFEIAYQDYEPGTPRIPNVQLWDDNDLSPMPKNNAKVNFAFDDDEENC